MALILTKTFVSAGKPNPAETLGSVIELSDTERRIVMASARLFRRRGFASVTMRDISAAVGLSKAGLYHHAPTKDGIFDLVIHYGNSLLMDQLLQARRIAGTPGERVRAFVHSRIDMIASNQDLMAIMWQERPRISGDVFDENAKMAESYRHGVRDLIRDAQRAGELRSEVDPHLLMLAIDGMTGWSCFWFHREGAMSPEEIGDAFWSFLADGVSVKRARRRSR